MTNTLSKRALVNLFALLMVGLFSFGASSVEAQTTPTPTTIPGENSYTLCFKNIGEYPPEFCQTYLNNDYQYCQQTTENPQTCDSTKTTYTLCPIVANPPGACLNAAGRQTFDPVPTNPSTGGSPTTTTSGNASPNCGLSNGDPCPATPVKTSDTTGKFQCGKGGDNVVKTSFNFGCRGENDPRPQVNPIWDISFAIIRFLIAGIGIVAVISVIVAGIQYSAAQGNPQAIQASIKRIQSSVGALLLYIFAWALINFIVPGGIVR